MNKKDCFIELVEEAFKHIDVENFIGEDERGKKGFEYWEEFKSGKITSKGGITENGAKILTFMIENEDKFNNIFKAKEIGEGLFCSGRSVSGSMKKLVTDGYCEKVGSDPVCYGLTDYGRSYSVDK